MKVQLKFKNKVFKDFLIDENGIIYDLNNTPQKTSIHQGRPEFKKIAIHRLVMYSFIGYREGMDIHHLNEDKFDNRLENLVYLTRAEHISYHAANRNEETKNKLKNANLGEKNPMYGKTPWNKGKIQFNKEEREAISKRISKRNIGRIWVNNGIVNKFVYPDQIPEGFEKGRLKINK